jgi:carbon-monoxide dehydrogenase medium subunit
VVTLGSNGAIASARIGIAGVGPKAYRATSVEVALIGKQPTEADVKAACESAAEGIDVMGDIHASIDYRTHLARVYARRAVLAAAARVG